MKDVTGTSKVTRTCILKDRISEAAVQPNVATPDGSDLHSSKRGTRDSSSTRVLTTRLPCEDHHTMHGEIWACCMTSLCLYALLFLNAPTSTLTIFTVIFPDAADDTYDIIKITNAPTIHGLRVSWGPVTRSSDIDRKHLNRSR
jgi:hypothetical protein